MKKNLRYLAYLWPLVVIAWATFVNRFPEGYTYGAGDFAQPVNIRETFHQFFYVWNNRLAAPSEGGFFSWFSAIPFYFLFYFLPALAGLSDTQTLSFVFFGYFSLTYFSFLFAARLLSGKTSPVFEPLLALAYAFNLSTFYFFTYSWGFSHIILLYVFIPVLTATFWKAVDKPDSSFVYWFLIVLFFSASSYTNSAFAVALALYLSLIIIFSWLIKSIRFNLGQLKVLTKMAVGGFLILSYWLWPTLVFVGEGLKSLGAGLFDLRGWLKAQSANLLSIFTGTPHYASYYPFKYESIFFSLLAFLPFLFFCWVVFKARGRVPERKKIITLALIYLVFVFLVKKMAPPLAELSVWFFSLPLASTLRSYEKAAIFLPFSLLMVIHLFVVNLGTRRPKVASGLILILILLSPLSFYKGGLQTKYSIAFPANKDYRTADYSILTKIPDDYYRLAETSNQNMSETRIQSMPYNVLNSILWVNYPKWKLIGSDPTENLFKKNILFSNSSTFVSQRWNMPEHFINGRRQADWYIRLLPFFSVSEIIHHKDVDISYAIRAQPRIDYLETQKLLEKVRETEYAALYKLPEGLVWPRFYVPEKVIGLDGQVSGLANIVSLEDFSKPSMIVWSGSGEASPKEVSARESSFYVKPEPVRSLLVEGEGKEGLEEVPVMPGARILPNSPFYFLVEWRENGLIDSAKNEMDQADLQLWLSSKRLVELERLSLVESAEKFSQSFPRYINQLRRAVDVLEELANRRADALPLVAKARAYFEEHKSIVDRLKLEFGDNSWEEKFREIYDLFQRAKNLIVGDGVYYYLLKITEPGDYAFYLNTDEIDGDFHSGALKGIKLKVDREQDFDLPRVVLNNSWSTFGPVSLKEGYHSLSFPLLRSQNLAENGSFEQDLKRLDPNLTLSSESTDKGRSLKLAAERYRRTEVEIPFNRLLPEARYNVSFDYKTSFGNPLKFMIWQDRNDLAELREREERGETVFTHSRNLGRDSFWQHFERTFKAGAQATQAKVIFSLVSRSTASISLIDNIVIERIFEPDLIAKSLSFEEKERELFETRPRLKFVKLNPTRYKVLVSQAQQPFVLVFSESFHPGWQVYATGKEEFPLRPLARSYLGGQVEESQASTEFFSDQTFSNLLKPTLAGNNHFVANGYANGWYIDPKALGGQGDFVLEIEFWPQRLFYLGILTSGLTFFLVALLLRRKAQRLI